MVQVKKYYLPPTPLVPNSPQPLLQYPRLLQQETDRRPDKVNELFDANDWKTQWIFRYGPTQQSHYHSGIHECMVVLSGTATVRFGVADTSNDLEASTYGDAREKGGIEVDARAGDVFVIPAGVAHKTYNTSPGESFALLTPGFGRGVRTDDVEGALGKVALSGFTMMGAYPKNCGTWDFSVGGEDVKDFARCWSISKPERDPVLGLSPEGLYGQWKEVPLPERKDKRNFFPHAGTRSKL